MITLRAETDVDAPPEQVWAALTDWEAQREWIPGTVVAVVSGDGRSVGSRIFAFTGIADLGFLDRLEIVEWQPPHRCRMRHAGRFVRGYGEFIVQPRGAAATFVLVEEIEPPFGPLGALGVRLGRPAFEAAMRRVCANFAARCVALAAGR